MLAINGGSPVRDKFLPYGRQDIDEEDVKAITETLRSDFLTTGPKVREFEENLAKYVGAKYAVAVSNGTAALHIACLSADIQKGDEVIVTPMTFAASSNCILYCGGTPVFADIEKDTGNISVNSIKEKITNKTKAIIAVDFTGHAVELNKLRKICEEYNLILIEDGAHSLGSEYKGEKVGSFADMTTFSFHPVKPITTGEGGIVTTNSKEIYKKLILFRGHGITRDLDFMIENQGPWYYEQLELGFNYRLPDINCALGLSQLKKIDSFINKRRSIVERYNELLKDIGEIELLVERDYSRSGYHIYIIKLNLDMLNVSRKEIFEALREENIGVNVHYLPVYLHPYYKKIGYDKGLCKEAENFYNRIITLPLYPGMNDKDVEDVVKAVKKVINHYKK